MERAEKNEEILETQIVTFFPYRISLVSLSFTFRCLLSRFSSRRWRWFLPSEYCDNDFYVLTVSSRQQRQQSYFTLQGDWSVNCDVLWMLWKLRIQFTHVRFTKHQSEGKYFPVCLWNEEQIFHSQYHFMRVLSSSTLPLSSSYARGFLFRFLLFTAEWYVCVSLPCRVPAWKVRFFLVFGRLCQSSSRVCVAERLFIAQSN